MGQLQLLQTGDESLQSMTILDAAGAMKIMQFPMEQQYQIIEASLKYVFRLIGLTGKNLPDPQAKDVLINFILTEHKTLTPLEIVKGFTMYAKGELDDNPELYQNFNSVFFSRIISAYKREKAKAVKKKVTAPHKPHVPTDDEKFKIDVDYFEKCLIEPYRDKKPFWSAGFMFKRLYRLGVIGAYSKKDKKRIATSAREEYEARLKGSGDMFTERSNSAILKRIAEQGLNPSEEDEIQKIKREIALNEWIDEQKKQGVTAKELRETVMSALYMSVGRTYNTEGEVQEAHLRSDNEGSTQETEEGGGSNS